MILAVNVDNDGEFTDMYWGETIVVVDPYHYVFMNVPTEVTDNIMNYKVENGELVHKNTGDSVEGIKLNLPLSSKA